MKKKFSHLPIFVVAIFFISNHQAQTLLKDIYPGSSSSNISTYTVVDNNLAYFTANDGTHGKELWKTDGTTAGTVLVEDLNPGASWAQPGTGIGINGDYYFNCNPVNPFDEELWKSSGTAATTDIFMNIHPTSHSQPSHFTKFGNIVLFNAKNSNLNKELWRTNGTVAGTYQVKDIRLGSWGGDPNSFVVAQTRVFFIADDGTTGDELWVTDGTEAGTSLVKDISTGSSNSGITNMTVIGDNLFFRADDDIHGYELWFSDGTTAGTNMVLDFDPGSDSGNPQNLTASNGILFFYFHDNIVGSELWRSDGTLGGTYMVKDIYLGSSSSLPTHLTDMDGILVFAAYDAGISNELWRSDGTETGTYLIKDIYSGVSPSNPSNFHYHNGLVYFTANSPGFGRELWKTDGTETGTALVADINPGSSGSISTGLPFASMGDYFLFRATNGTQGVEPYILFSPIVLPLELISFNGKTNEKNKAVLNWETLNESNLENFILEKSSDGKVWESRKTIPSQNKSDNYYSFTDDLYKNSQTYYRLKIMEIDGSSSYSKIIEFENYQEIVVTSITPNPFIGSDLTIDLDAHANSDFEITILDRTGKVIKNQSGILKKGGNKILISIENTPHGLYFLNIHSKNFHHNFKLIKT